MVNSVRQNTTNPNTAPIDARPYQLDLLKLERRGMRPMALKVLNGAQSRKAKLAAVAGVAAMLVSINVTSDAYAAKLNLKPAVAEQSSQVLRDAVACCDEITKFVNLNASQTALKEQIANLFLLIDDEHKRLEAFAGQLGARLVRAEDEPTPEDSGPGTDVGGGGGKESNLWLSKLNFQTDEIPTPESEPSNDVGGGGGKDNAAWLSRL